MQISVKVESDGKYVEFISNDTDDIEHARLTSIIQLNAAVEKLASFRELQEMKCMQAMYNARHVQRIRRNTAQATHDELDADDAYREYA